ncbi:MAG: class I SAM-dependent methyltransferase [Gammaproteobacteria bacterium]
MSVRTLTMTDPLYDYLLRVSVREPELLARLRAETAELPEARMQISPEQGQFMGLLVELLGVRRAVEVGTFTGYSALCMAQAMPADGRLVCCDVSRRWTDIARRYWREAGLDDRIELHRAPAIETLDRLLAEGGAGRFDFAFIDADKAGYLDYYERCLTLVRRGGLVALDNTLWGGSVADPEDRSEDTRAIRELNEQLYGDERVTLSLLPIGDGLTLARKR